MIKFKVLPVSFLTTLVGIIHIPTKVVSKICIRRCTFT